MKALLAVIAVVLFLLIVNKTQEERLEEYNNHVCVDVYGLDKNCK